MPNLLRQLFQDRPARRVTVPLGDSLRAVVRQSIEQTGNGRYAALVANQFPILFSSLDGGQAFPNDVARLRPVRALRPLDSPIKAIELIAITLLPSKTRLAEFQRLMDRSTNPAANVEEPNAYSIITTTGDQFGFSTWQAGEIAANMSDDDDEASQYLRELEERDRLGLCSILARERFVACAGSTAVTDLDEHVRQRGYPDSLRAIVTAWIHPAPPLSEREICDTLALSIHLPALDRWFLLQRCVGAYLATGDFNERLPRLASAYALFELVDAIGGIFAYNLLALLPRDQISQRKGCSYTSHLVEALLSDVLSETGGAPPAHSQDALGDPLRQALAGLADPDSYAVDGHIAVLARQAIVEGATRGGTILASIVLQCVPLSERRARSALVWARLFGHPTLIAASKGGRIGHAIRARRVGPRSDAFETLVEAANRGADNEVITLANNASDLSVEEKAIFLDALLSTHKGDAAIELANDIILNHAGIAERLPIGELVRAIPQDVTTDLSQAIHRGVLAGFCARFDTPGAETKRNDSLEDVLDCAGVSFPSEAIGKFRQAVPTPIAFYFLENVCVPQVMDTVPVGRSTEELINERIRILSALRTAALESAGLHASADEVSSVAERFELEMKSHATHLAVNSELASLEQRRIYVDTEGLRARLGATLVGDFQRYRRFIALDLRSDSDLEQLRRLLAKQFPDTMLLDLSELSRALTSESDRALSKMLLEIRDGFATSHEFGLDGYLSGGIRHGNLEFHLREPFATGDLLGVLHSDGSFSPPRLADTLIANCHDTAARATVHESFHKLTRELHALIDEVLMEWVQVDLDSTNTRALFQLSISRLQVRALESKLRHVETLEEFIDICIQYWWNIIDDNLEAARGRIQVELHERLLSILRQLEKDCEGALKVPPLRVLLSKQVGTVADAIASAITKLAEWFHRPTAGATGDVEASTALNVCLRLLRGLFPTLNIQPTVEIMPATARLRRRDFKHWVDIIHVLLINAVEHGRADDLSEVLVRWRFESTGVELVVTNALGPHVDRADVDARLEASRLRREEEAELSRVRTEGRSGLIKVLKYARTDLRCPSASVCVSRTGSSVEAKVSLPGKDWVVPVFEIPDFSRELAK